MDYAGGMDVEQLKDDVHSGRIGVDRLIDVIAALQRQLQAANKQIDELKKRIDELEKQATAKTDEPFSLRAEEQRQEARGKRRRKRNKPARRGRVSTADKVAKASLTEPVYPAGVAREDCWLSHTRPVWRLKGGQAVLIAYQIYRGPGSRYGKIPGVLGRSEFGWEIVLAIAYQVYFVGLSFDKVCAMLMFFQNLRLKKSQVDSLLYQLARSWKGEFDVLCTLLSHSAVVHADETSWSLNSVWAMLSESARVLLFGVHKDADTLQTLLDPATFAGIVISDDAAVYANFTHAQKCWAHLLRKAIKLTLVEPANKVYRHLTDRLLEIYHAACRAQRDGRLSDAGRALKVAALEAKLLDLCEPVWFAEPRKLTGAADDHRLLCEELMRLLFEQQLFTFVTAAPVATPLGETQPVAGTNNEAERTLRASATARKTGRTNKTMPGARRQTIVVSVIESMRQYLPTFTLTGIIDEVERWRTAGQSCFSRLLDKLKLSPPIQSILDQLLPLPEK
jgi:hypothetical protein